MKEIHCTATFLCLLEILQPVKGCSTHHMFISSVHRNVNTGYDHDSNENANPMVRFSASPACAQTSTPDVVTNISGEKR